MPDVEIIAKTPKGEEMLKRLNEEHDLYLQFTAAMECQGYHWTPEGWARD